MKPVPAVLVAVSITVAQGSCILPDNRTTVRLVNDAESPVDVQLFYDDDQNLPEALIENEGTERNIVVESGEVHEFSVDCDDLQVIFIKDADLNILGGIGPDEDTDPYREPDDFGCGDTITFTFTQNITATDLDIAFRQQR